ncbi:MAG: hypothetical protein EB079_06020 [Verrucomicrobia bacterium]|nr:hypothetical protein [Verrucomicrobiota bacterium]
MRPTKEFEATMVEPPVTSKAPVEPALSASTRLPRVTLTAPPDWVNFPEELPDQPKPRGPTHSRVAPSTTSISGGTGLLGLTDSTIT